jgi:hypothetical protein
MSDFEGLQSSEMREKKFLKKNLQNRICDFHCAT